MLGIAIPVPIASLLIGNNMKLLEFGSVDDTVLADHVCFKVPHDCPEPHRLLDAVKAEPSNGAVLFGAKMMLFLTVALPPPHTP